VLYDGRRMDNLADRFEISAKRWARAIEAVERAYPIPKASLDAEARMGLSLDRERGAVAYAGVRLLAGQAITSVQLDVFESPRNLRVTDRNADGPRVDDRGASRRR